MSAALELRSKEQKDAELEQRIRALRRKNQALIQRYQEIEEDRRRAEREGGAVTLTPPRRGRPPDPAPPPTRWLDPDLPPSGAKERKPPTPPRPSRGTPPRRASRRPPRGDPPAQPFWEGEGPEGPPPADRGGRGRRQRGGRGGSGGESGPDRKSKEWEERRRQNIERMKEELEKIAQYERGQREGLQEKNPVRNFLDDPRRSGSFQEGEGSRRHGRNWGGPDFQRLKTGRPRDKPWRGGPSAGQGRGGSVDPTLCMTGRERAEYERWKRERELIDRERLQRHRNPSGHWRREWDKQKTNAPFLEGLGVDRGGEEKQQLPQGPSPTPGELPLPRRRRKGRGGPPKNYSMHDNRWEEAPPQPDTPKQPEESPSGALPVAPSSPSPEEDEDQWEDVSEEEEEEEGEGEEEEGEGQGEAAPSPVPPSAAQPPPRASPSPLPPPGHQDGGAAPSAPSAPSSPSPFSPLGGAEGRDWGEEMDQALPCSPRSPGEPPGLTPPEPPLPPGGAETSETSSQLGAAPPTPPQAEATAGPPQEPPRVEFADFQRAPR